MKIHLHACCWNEEKILPFFFRHYDKFVDRYFIHDDHSTDGTLDILARHPRVTVLPLRAEGDSFIVESMRRMNEFWRLSRGEADWVGVCDMDEFFWHPDIRWYLGKCRRRGITWLVSNGFEMISDTFPGQDDDLPANFRYGVPHAPMSKPTFFNPLAIEESGFAAGRHLADPKGHVVHAVKTEILLLHYKFLGIDYVMTRHAALAPRRREGDHAAGYNFHWEAKVTLQNFGNLMQNRREVVPKNPRVSLKQRLFGGPEAFRPARSSA